MIELRDYQVEAVEACYDHLRRKPESNPAIVLPTGAGKTPVMGQICRDATLKWGQRVLVLAHVKELLQQTEEKLRIMAPEIDVGVYSAGLKRRETNRSVTIAGIQSVHKRAFELCGSFPFAAVLIDEAHLIPPDGDGRYRQMLEDLHKANPKIKVIGLTATPYRMAAGPICTPNGYLNEVCYEAGVKDLIDRGFLCPIRSPSPVTGRVDTSNLRIVNGEFAPHEMEEAFDEQAVAAINEILGKTQDRKSVLLFCSGISHADVIFKLLQPFTDSVDIVTGYTPSEERREILERFKRGDLKYLVNVDVLTTGFDATRVDCVCLLRATLSPGLYYQMVGRGLRLDPSKSDCLVLDFGGNIERHGPIDTLTSRMKPRQSRGDGEEPRGKTCPGCEEIIASGFSVCPECGHEFERESAPHDGEASEAAILSEEPVVQVVEVMDVAYQEWTKRDAPEGHPKTLRVDYVLGDICTVSEWVCIEHSVGSFAHNKALAWWQARSLLDMPATAAEAARLATLGALADPIEVSIKEVTGQRWPELLSSKWGDPPEFDEEQAIESSSWEHGDELATPEGQQSARATSGMFNDDSWDDVPF